MDSISTLWLPSASSTAASDIDALFYFILYASVIMLSIVTGFMIIFGIRYRRRRRDSLTTPRDNHLGLEIAWTLIPAIIMVIVFIWAFRGYMNLYIIPGNAMEIKGTGQMWFWSFDYPDGITTVNELVVPVNQPVKILLSSRDVIHSFFVPSFRVKMDALPNRYTSLWFEAIATGEYNLFCTEYCGTGHSEMIGTVKVLTAENYATWLEENASEGEGMTPVEYGKQLYASRGCVTCHSLDGSPNQGPTFMGRFGTEVLMTDGTRLMMDENYIRQSILDPGAKIVNGFQPIMPTFQSILKDKQIDALVAFIKSLQEQQ